jgi:hypothetical protein
LSVVFRSIFIDSWLTHLMKSYWIATGCKHDACYWVYNGEQNR